LSRRREGGPVVRGSNGTAQPGLEQQMRGAALGERALQATDPKRVGQA
jgi:hypothetical protein